MVPFKWRLPPKLIRWLRRKLVLMHYRSFRWYWPRVVIGGNAYHIQEALRAPLHDRASMILVTKLHALTDPASQNLETLGDLAGPIGGVLMLFAREYLAGFTNHPAQSVFAVFGIVEIIRHYHNQRVRHF